MHVGRSGGRNKRYLLRNASVLARSQTVVGDFVWFLAHLSPSDLRLNLRTPTSFAAVIRCGLDFG